VGIILAGVIAAAGFFVLFGFIVMWLWNWLMPTIFSLPAISFWQGWGLLLLSSILFKRHPSVSHAGREHRRKRALRERLYGMNDRDPQSDRPGPAPGDVV